MKKWIASVLTAVLLLGLLPTVALAVDEKDISNTGLTINTTNVNQVSGVYRAGGGTVQVTYDETSKTLTFILTNAALTAPLHVTEDLNAVVELNGENTINGGSDKRALFVGSGSLTVNGAGSLTATGSDYALYGYKGVSISGVTIIATSSKTAAIQANGDISISESTVTAGCKGNEFGGYGIYVYGDNGDISLSNSQVEANTTRTSFYTGQNITIDGGSVTVKATGWDSDNGFGFNGLQAGKKITIRNGASVSGSSTYPTLYAAEKIQINGSTVNVESTGDSGIWTAGSLSIESAPSVTAKGIGHGTGAQTDITIDNSTVSAFGQYGIGIFTQGDISIGGDKADVTVKSMSENLPAMVSSAGDVNITSGKMNIISTQNIGIQAVSVHISGGEVSVDAASHPVYLYGEISYTGGILTLSNASNTYSILTDYNNDANTYTEYYLVTLHPQNGEKIASVLVQDGQKLTPNTPQKDNCTFDGWYTAASGGEKWNLDEKTVVAHTALYAQWTANHVHAWSVDWSKDAAGHWHECTAQNCDVSENSGKDGYAAHTPGDWIIDQPATSSTAGSRHKACTVCGYITETETIPATGGSSGGGGSASSVYTPEIKQPAEGGTVTVFPSNPKQGDSVTVKPKLDVGYEVDKVTVTNKNGKPVEVAVKLDGTYIFTQPSGSVKIEITYKLVEKPWLNPFADVPEGAWYYDAVRFVSENGLMNGYSDGLFGVNDNLSRAQLAQILFNKEGRPVVNYLLQYGDVATGTWYTEAVRWATSQGIVGGYGNGNFGPSDPITREQLAVMLWRYSGSPAATNKDRYFNDTDEIGGFALEAMRWAVENGIINGYGDGRLGPQGQATRAQVAQMMKNFLEGKND